jgi:hypothetical protein
MATSIVTAMKKRKMAFPKSRYVQRSGFGFLHGSLVFRSSRSIFSRSVRQRAGVPPLAPHKALKSGALSSPGEAGRMA